MDWFIINGFIIKICRPPVKPSFIINEEKQTATAVEKKVNLSTVDFLKNKHKRFINIYILFRHKYC